MKDSPISDELFRQACGNGNIEIVKKYFEQAGDVAKLQAPEALMYACYNGHLEIVNFLFEQGGDAVKAQAPKALRFACQRGHLEIVKFLFEQGGEEVKTKAPEALSAACTGGNLEIVKFLFEQGGEEVKTKAPEALMLACHRGNLEIVKLLFEQGGEEVKTKAPEVLSAACYSSNLEIVKLLFEQGGEEVKTKAPEALSAACARGNLELVKLLFEQGGDAVKAKAPEALSLACIQGNLVIVKLLFEEGGDAVKTKAPEVLSSACYKGVLEIVKLLFEQGGDAVKAKAPEALSSACIKGHLEIVKLLFEQGGDAVKTKAPEVLIDACYGRNLEIVKLLFEQGGDAVKTKAPEALSAACYSGNLEIVKLLFEQGGDAVKTQAPGELRMACVRGHLEVVKLLFEQGGDAVKAQAPGALIDACQQPNSMIVKYLIDNGHFHGKEQETFETLCQYNFHHEAEQFIPQLTIHDIPISKFIDIDLKKPDMAKDIKSFYEDPVFFLESKNAPALHIEVLRLLELDRNAKQVLYNKYENTESAMNAAMLEKAEKHFNESVWPYFKASFEAVPGDTEQEKISYIESQMRSVILDRILQDESTSEEAKKFIIEHRKVLENKSDLDAMNTLRKKYLNSITNVNHIAWRCLDKEAPRVVWTNMMTAPFDSENALTVRKRAAVYFLAVIDEKEPDDKEMRISNFIGQLADIRRAHNKTEAAEADNPSCVPGTLGRVANMGTYHSIAALPMDEIKLALDIYDSYVLENFKAALNEIVERHENDIDMALSEIEPLFDGLTLLTKQFAKEIMMGTKPYPEYYLQARKSFLDRLGKGKYQTEGLEAIAKEVENLLQQQQPGKIISPEERPILMAALFDVASNDRANKLGIVYQQYVGNPGLSEDEKIKIVNTPGFNIYEEGSDKFILFDLFARTILSFTQDVKLTKTFVEALLNKTSKLENTNKEQWIQLIKETGKELNVDEKLIKNITEQIKTYWSDNPLEKSRRSSLLDLLKRTASLYTQDERAARAFTNKLNTIPNLTQLDKNGWINLLNTMKDSLEEGGSSLLIKQVIEHINQRWPNKPKIERASMLNLFKPIDNNKGKEEEKEDFTQKPKPP